MSASPHIVVERNDAQHAFLSILESLDDHQTATEVVVHEALHGTLNLAALTNAGFRRVQHLRFAVPGELTHISNIPDSITTLEIPHQRLTVLDHLPEKLARLNVANNDLVHFSAKALTHLQYLNLNNNRLESLTDLPTTLLELECNNNVLKRLDLSPTVVLAKLHCRENPLLTLERLPPTVSADLEFDSTPFLDVSFRDQDGDGDGDGDNSKGNKDILVRKRNFNVRECLQQYFEMKHKYEEDTKKRRRETKERALRRGMSLKGALEKARRIEPNCVQCGQPGGTHFQREKQHYRARCNHGKSPCDLNVDIFMGDHDSLSTLLHEFQDHMEDSKQAIIEQKMQTVFGYLDKKQSAELFQQNMDLYQEVHENCQTFMKKYMHLYNSPERKAEMERQLEHVLELDADEARLMRRYKETGDRALLHQAMVDHARLVVPAHKALQRMRYPHMWVETQTMDDTTEMTMLRQYPHTLQEDDIVYGEPARVIHFQT